MTQSYLHPRYSLLWHTGHHKKKDHIDLVLEREFGSCRDETALDKFEIFQELEGDITLKYFRRIRRKYLDFEGEMAKDDQGRSRGRVEQMGSGFLEIPNTGVITLREGLLDGYVLDFAKEFRQEILHPGHSYNLIHRRGVST